MKNPETSAEASRTGHALMHASEFELPQGWALVVTVRPDEWDIELLDQDGDLVMSSEELDCEGCVGSSPSSVIDQMIERAREEMGAD